MAPWFRPPFDASGAMVRGITHDRSETIALNRHRGCPRPWLLLDHVTPGGTQEDAIASYIAKVEKARRCWVFSPLVGFRRGERYSISSRQVVS